MRGARSWHAGHYEKHEVKNLGRWRQSRVHSPPFEQISDCECHAVAGMLCVMSY